MTSMARFSGRSFRVRTGLIFLFGACLLGFAAPGRAQDWQLQAPWPTSHNLRGLCMLGPDEAWVVGSAGLSDGTGSVLHTSDGGLTWEKAVLTTSQINAVFFIDAQHGWIVGNDTFRTTDGGGSWVHINGWGTLYDVFFIDTQRGWACGNGGMTYRTTDGGLSWTGTGPIAGWTLREIYFADALHGWTADIGGGIHRSTDGGATWTVQFSDSQASNLGSVQFFDAQEGWVFGGDHFYHTTNGGATWLRSSVPGGTWANNGYFAPDRLHGVAVGYQGNVVRTTNGGATWITVNPTGGRPDLNRVRMWDAQHGFYVGDAAMLYVTGDGGQTWTNRQSGGWAMTHALDAQDDTHAWAACEGGEILRTTDGVFWDRVFTPGIDVYGFVSDVSFVDLTTGYAVGKHEEFAYSDFKVLRSTDGGANWQIRAVFTDMIGLDRVETLTPSTLIVLGDIPGTNGLLNKSTDAGTTWINVTPAPFDVANLDFVNPQIGWTAGDRIHKTTNAGASWVEQLVSPGFFIDISMADEQNGWAVGAPGIIVHTTNGGTNWVPQNSGTTESLFAVSAVSATEAWAAVLTGSVIHTANGGATWTSEVVDSGPFTNFVAIAFPSSGNGWVGGNVGIWHHRSVASVPPPPTNGATIAPPVALLPASPNPFRDRTSVRFTLRNPGPVTLTIFDVSGHRVRELLRGDRGEGAHEVFWSGRDDAGQAVPNGIYFVRLEGAAGSASQRVLRIR